MNLHCSLQTLCPNGFQKMIETRDLDLFCVDEKNLSGQTKKSHGTNHHINPIRQTDSFFVPMCEESHCVIVEQSKQIVVEIKNKVVDCQQQQLNLNKQQKQKSCQQNKKLIFFHCWHVSCLLIASHAFLCMV